MMRTDHDTSLHVFLGPSLDLDEARAILPGATFLPPAGLGDVYALAQRKGVRAICLIDGRFLTTPAVWHKEILFALSTGIAVYGTASMGALRAAEMASLGMRGVGRVFEQYASGALQDDDEVAVLHGPAEFGYPPFSLAMASLRYGFERAQQEGLVEATVAAAICARIKALHFTQRSRANVGSIIGDLAPAPAPLLAFVTAPECDLKRRDARELLHLLATADIVSPVACAFEETAVWRTFVERQQCRLRYRQLDGGAALWGYFRLRSGTIPDLHAQAWSETLEQVVGRQFALEPDQDAARRFLEVLRRQAGLLDSAAVRGWLDVRALDAGAMQEWARGRALRQLLQTRFKAQFQLNLQAVALRSPEFNTLRDEIERRSSLAEDVLARFTSEEQLGHLWKLYHDTFIGSSTPLHLAAEDCGFESPDAFLDALLREYLLSQHSSSMVNNI